MSYQNYDSVREQIMAAGIILRPEDLLINTHAPVRRNVEGDREKRGWYRLYELPIADGDILITGSFGIWHGADSGTQKIVLDKSQRKTLDADQLAALKARQDADKKRADAERERKILAASNRATSWWRQCLDQGESAYLIKKGLPGRLYGARLSAQGNTVIPMQDGDGKVFGLQVIYRDLAVIQKKGRDKDFTPPGLAKKGHWFAIGSPVAGGIVLLCEGFATGASLHEATGLPVVIAFDAGNLLPVALAIRKRYRGTRLLVCADDDYLKDKNTGVEAAQSAALAVEGGWLKPEFPAARPTNRKGPTDFNDLHTHPGGGLHMVAAQVSASIMALGWMLKPAIGGALAVEGGGEGGRVRAVSTMPLDEIVNRFIFIDDDTGEFVFDTQTRQVCKVGKVTRMLPAKVRMDDVKDHPVWKARAVYIDQIGFDPGNEDPNIICNRWTGWPTTPKPGSCEILLDLLRYLCSGEDNASELYTWMLKWLAYPIQNPGAKMQSAVVVHGPQGTGKSFFFEAYAKIFGDYSMVLNQGAIEDKFNADWSERKLFILADEIVARSDMYHLKNQLKNFITGEWVRVNPKNVAAHRERNHMNIIFLSNEKRPVVIENDDRRHCVIWTPTKLGDDFYTEVSEEIANGGIEALHHHLLQINLENFHPWTKPPMTDAKRELIDINLESEDRFLRDWITGETPWPFTPCASMDLYAAYRLHCTQHGVSRPRESNVFLSAITKRHGWVSKQTYRYDNSHYQGKPKQTRMVIPDEKLLQQIGHTMPDGITQSQWMTDCYFQFNNALNGG